MKKIVIPAFILIIGILVIVFFVSKGKKAEAKYITADVQRGDIAVIVTATGSLQAVTTVQVGSQVSGTISALYVDFNDNVKKGQVLAQLDPAFLKAQVVQAQADLEKSMASKQLAQRDSERAVSLYQRNLISESDMETSITNYELAKAAVKSSQANLDRLKTNLQYATIQSPIDGVVISRNVDVGQTVAASLQAPTLFTIAQDLTKMQVQASIDEADIGRISQGQDVSFTVDAYPDKKFSGTVQQIRLAPEINQNVVSYDVIISVSNPDLLLKPGMTANVTIMVDRANDVLKVPSAALRYRPAMPQKKQNANSQRSRQAGLSQSGQNGMRPGSSSAVPDSTGPRRSNRNTVWILGPDNKPEPVPVQAGISDGSFTEVNSDGLHEGDKVITGQEGVQQSTGSQEVNPFVPRFGGGRGR